MLGLKLTEMEFRHEFCDIGHRSLTDGGKSIDVTAINNFPPVRFAQFSNVHLQGTFFYKPKSILCDSKISVLRD